MEDRRIERVHLDPPGRVDPSTPQQIPDDKPADAVEFSRMLQALSRERHDTPGETTLSELLASFVAPSPKDPAILSGDRAIAILEQLLTTILPQLDDDDEFRQLAVAIIGDEIKQRRRLRARRRRDAAA
jgi:hypothetical protein